MSLQDLEKNLNESEGTELQVGDVASRSLVTAQPSETIGLRGFVEGADEGSFRQCFAG